MSQQIPAIRIQGGPSLEEVSAVLAALRPAREHRERGGYEGWAAGRLRALHAPRFNAGR